MMSFINSLVFSAQSVVADHTDLAQVQAQAVPEGGISPLAWIIILALSSAVAGEALFIKKLYTDLTKSHAEKGQFVNDQLSLIKTLRDEFDKNGKKDGDGKDTTSGGA